MAEANSPARDRQPHVVMDLPSRSWKALKIERLLDLDRRPGTISLLEVGTGSGGIAHHFAEHPSGRFRVCAVDTVDNRLLSDHYEFSLVADANLPFPDASFDVVLSNHVIEHVGDAQEQLRHLGELRRVLRPGGIGYLAVPNRWMLVEPHYRLAFLSWLPRGWRDGYLRHWRGVGHYDCEPLQLPQLERFFRASGLACRNRGIDALRLVFEIERPGSWQARLLSRVPDRMLAPFQRIIPTLIYTFSHA
jgi:SAM-dependent methyltransferase